MGSSWPPVPSGRTAWSNAARQRLATILGSLLPPEELGGDPSLLPAFAGGLAGSLAPGRRLGIRAMSEAVWWLAPLALLGKPTSFGSLDASQRDQLFTKVVYSRLYLLRLAGLGIKALAGLAVVGDPLVQAELGLDTYPEPLPPVGGHVRWDEDIAGIGRDTAGPGPEVAR